jgi:hypothetical protein
MAKKTSNKEMEMGKQTGKLGGRRIRLSEPERKL